MAGLTFPEASEQVLTYLKAAVPLGLWAVTRYDGTDQMYLSVHDDAYGAKAGDRGNWNESLCQFMVTGAAPRVAPDVTTVPQYAAAAGFQADGQPLHRAVHLVEVVEVGAVVVAARRLRRMGLERCQKADAGFTPGLVDGDVPGGDLG